MNQQHMSCNWNTKGRGGWGSHLSHLPVKSASLGLLTPAGNRLNLWLGTCPLVACPRHKTLFRPSHLHATWTFLPARWPPAARPQPRKASIPHSTLCRTPTPSLKHKHKHHGRHSHRTWRKHYTISIGLFCFRVISNHIAPIPRGAFATLRRRLNPVPVLAPTLWVPVSS